MSSSDSTEAPDVLNVAAEVFGLSSTDSECANEDSPVYFLPLIIRALHHGVAPTQPYDIGVAMGKLTHAQQDAKKQAKKAKERAKLSMTSPEPHHIDRVTEWQVLCTDITILLAFLQVYSNSAREYPQVLCTLQKAYSRSQKLLPFSYRPKYHLHPPHVKSSAVDVVSQKSSNGDIESEVESASAARTSSSCSRWKTFWSSLSSAPVPDTIAYPPPKGSVKEFILSGVAFSYGAFGILFSILPLKFRRVLTTIGYKHNHKVALEALAVSAAHNDVHSILAGLVYMTYCGHVFQATGYLAKEGVMKECETIAEQVSLRYPKGLFWIFNKAQVQWMTGNLEGSIKTLQAGLQADRQIAVSWVSAQLAFELGLRLLQARRYRECLPILERFREKDDWSKATSLFLVAGCHIGMKDIDLAQKTFNELSEAIEQRGKERVFIEEFIKDQLEFYKEKQTRRGGDSTRFAECIRINPAEVLSVAMWSSYPHTAALMCANELAALTPSVTVSDGCIQMDPVPGAVVDLDTPDELALRALILGIAHRTLGNYLGSGKLFEGVATYASNSWFEGVARLNLVVAEKQKVQEHVGFNGEEYYDTLEYIQENVKREMHRAKQLCGQRNIKYPGMLENRLKMLEQEIGIIA